MDSKLVNPQHAQLVAAPSYETLPVYRVATEDNSQPPTYANTEVTKVPSAVLTISTAGRSLSSGFPYHPSLTELGISPSDWENFNRKLQNAAAATACQKALAIFSGIATAAVIIDPWTSSCVARYVWNKQVAKNVITGMAQDTLNSTSHDSKRETVGTVLVRWNEKWSASGLKVGLEVIQHRKQTSGAMEREESIENIDCHQVQGHHETKKCTSVKRSCGARKSCHLRDSWESNERCGRRNACGKGRSNRQSCGKEKKGVSFRLVVQMTGEEVSEKKGEKYSY